MQRNVT